MQCIYHTAPHASPCEPSLFALPVGFSRAMKGGRVPSEPVADGEAGPGIRLFSLDFDKLPGDKNSEEYNSAVRKFVDRLGQQCVELTATTTTDGLPWSSAGEKDNITCEHLQVAGTPLPMSRHTAEFNAPAPTVLQLFNALNYTRLIDPYAFHVEAKEHCDLAPEYEWCHVAWTVDSIHPLFAVRDFVTLDFVNASQSLIVSRSVRHGLVPETKPPTKTSFLLKSLKSRTYRVPLLYALRVLPVDENNCVVTQLQWSDVAGVVPDDIVVKSVEKFGYESLARMRKIAQTAVEKNVVAPIEDPLLPAWTPDPYVKIPELL